MFRILIVIVQTGFTALKRAKNNVKESSYFHGLFDVVSFINKLSISAESSNTVPSADIGFSSKRWLEG